MPFAENQIYINKPHAQLLLQDGMHKNSGFDENHFLCT